MSRPLPDCAWCGKTLVRSGRGRITTRFGKLPGAPEIGWHFDCHKLDDLAKKHVPGNSDPTEMIEAIQYRGYEGRVVRLVKRHEKGGKYYVYERQ